MSAEAQPALKDWFNVARYRQIADLLADAHPGFDRKRFLAVATDGLDELTLIQRVRRATEACRATLPADFPEAVAVLKRIAPQVQHGFVGIFLPDFVGQHGHGHFEESMDALKFFTPFSSSEFAIREFLRRDLDRTLAVMTRWSHDPDEHIRRLASEGCRPRLPWSFRLEALVRDPAPVRPILENLRADPALYVRKSVANHLNDITKDHPAWVLALIKNWDASVPATTWIIKHGLRTLIKGGHREALSVIGAGRVPRVALRACTLTPARVAIGGAIEFSFTLTSQARSAQTLVVDYIVHYQKKSGRTGQKVFKLKTLSLAAGATLHFRRRLSLVNLSTRSLHPGVHRLEIMINGRIRAEKCFLLRA